MGQSPKGEPEDLQMICGEQEFEPGSQIVCFGYNAQSGTCATIPLGYGYLAGQAPLRTN